MKPEISANTTSISLRTTMDKIAEIDSLAKSSARSRNSLLNEALEYYIDLKKWEFEEIKKGLKDIEEGRIIPFEQVVKELNEYLDGIDE